jgi:hypothetical protein
MNNAQRYPKTYGFLIGWFRNQAELEWVRGNEQACYYALFQAMELELQSDVKAH